MPLVKPRPALSLEESVAAAVEACGGLKHAADALDLGTSQVQRYSDPVARDTITLRLAAMLDRAAGRPFLAAWLARASGCVLLPVSVAARSGPIVAHLAKVGEEAADVFAAAAKAFADDTLTARERAELARKLDELMTAAATFRAAVMPETDHG